MPSSGTKKPSENYVLLFSKILSGNNDALESMKNAANSNSTAAYYLAVVYDKGYYKGEVNSHLSLAYYCMAAYLGSPEAMEHLQKHKSSTVNRCLNYIQNLGYEDQFDFNHIISIIENPCGQTNTDNKPTEVSENLEDIDENDHRAKRDALNKKVKEWKNERDRLNEEVKSLSNEINESLSHRDYLNKQTKDLKAEHDKYQKLAKETRQQLSVPGKIMDAKRKKEINDNAAKYTKKANDNHKEMEKVVEQAQNIQRRIIQLSSMRDALHEQADNAHRQFISYKEQADQEHTLLIKSIKDKKTITTSVSERPPGPFVIEQTDNSNATKVIFLDFDHYMDEVKFHDPTFGTGLREQFKTSSVKTPYVDVIDLFRNVFLKESITLYLSTPNYVKEWEKNKKYPTIQYLKNVAIRTEFSETHDLVLVADIVLNQDERFKIGCIFDVKGFVFIDVNMIHSGEIEVRGRVLAKLGQEKNIAWIDYNGAASITHIYNQIDSKIIGFLEENNVIEDTECVKYMILWKKYLDSRNYILQENEIQKLELTSVNLQMATFCDDCTDEIRSHNESIPYVRIPREKRQGWFINQVDDDHCRRVLLLHVCKEYGNECYQGYIEKTDFSFKKEFDQFTRDGLKLFGDQIQNENEYDLEENEGDRDKQSRAENSILDTYDSRISTTYVEIINPDLKIKALEAKYSKRRVAKEQELTRKRDDALDLAQKEYRVTTLPSEIKAFEENLAISKSELESFAKENNMVLNSSNMDEVESSLKEGLISKETIRLAESNYVLLKNKFDIQYTNALSDFDSMESVEFNEEKESILKENSTLCLHVYFDLSEDYDINDENRIKSLNDAIANISHPYVRRNLDGDRVLLRRQSEGINNLMPGFRHESILDNFLV